MIQKEKLDESAFASGPSPAGESSSLDPRDWDAFRNLGTDQLNKLVAHLEGAGDRPAWQPVPDSVKESLRAPLPLAPQGAEQVCEEIRESILPWCLGNTHPRFFGWVHGTGTAGGMLAEMYSGAINANLGGREHAPVYVERTVIDWCRQIFQFPESASGLLLSGTSMANLVALSIARNHHAPVDIREEGLLAIPQPMVVYTSADAHCSVRKAIEFLGLGRKNLRAIPVNSDHQIDLNALTEAIRTDREQGRLPFCVVGTVGTVDCAAIDDIDGLASICQEHGLWLHIDGAFGALAILSEEQRPLLKGIERADSLAFDFHKWLHVPYDAGCLLVRDGQIHRAAFATEANYLSEGLGAAAGAPWYCELGPELSRGFRALKVWFTIKEHGLRRLGQKIAENCLQAAFLRELVVGHPHLELLAPVRLNVVCFRYTCPHFSEADHDRFNSQLVHALQESGCAVPSTTRIRGRFAIRVNITNHRTRLDDLQVLMTAIDQTAERLVEQFPKEVTPKIIASFPVTLHKESAAEVRKNVEALRQQSDFQPLLKGVILKPSAQLSIPFRVNSDGTIDLDERRWECVETGAVLLRHALEIAALKRIDHETSPPATVLRALFACDTAMKYWRFHFPPVGALDETTSFLNQYFEAAPISLATADVAALKRLAERLLPLQSDEESLVEQLTPSDWRIIRERLKSCEIVGGPTEYLLTTGGDSRLEINPHLGFSKYGCRRAPSQELISFASSTATSITHQNLEECEQVRQQLTLSALRGELETTVAEIAGTLKRQILNSCGAIDLPGTEVLLCGSGTDAELFASCLTAMASDLPLTNVLIAPDETGSGVPIAAQGCHYDNQTPFGASVTRGESLLGGTDAVIEIVRISVRDLHGQLRSVQSLNREIEQAVQTAVERGNCLLHILAASKTGWQGPDRSLVQRLTSRYGSRLSVIVDACQLRQDRNVLREYLRAGYLLQVTGSKTFGGPPFSGALLIPKDHAAFFARIATRNVRFQDYAACIEWPDDWTLTQQTLNRDSNVGLLLRWSAAAREMRCFAAIPDHLKTTILNQLAHAISDLLSATPEAVPLDAHSAGRRNGVLASAWDQVQTIFSFRLKHVAQGNAESFLTPAEMKTLHRLLNTDLSFVPDLAECEETAALCKLIFQIGQPVELSQSLELPVSVLRICTGAHIVSRVTFDSSLGKTLTARGEGEQNRIRLLFQKMRLILKNWHSLQQFLPTEQNDLCLSQQNRQNLIVESIY